jgi:hypothetical protein
MYIPKLRDHQGGQSRPRKVHKGIYIKEPRNPPARPSHADWSTESLRVQHWAVTGSQQPGRPAGPGSTLGPPRPSSWSWWSADPSPPRHSKPTPQSAPGLVTRTAPQGRPGPGPRHNNWPRRRAGQAGPNYNQRTFPTAVHDCDFDLWTI